ncbi:MAG: hypothetical protein M1815_001401 [Lichina confinis]|nr:MAG: hypothetical protein M1815_001401 [Lichina confinis]
MHLFRLLLPAVSIAFVLGRRPVATTAKEGDDGVVTHDELAGSLPWIATGFSVGGAMIGTIGTWAVLRRDIKQGKPMTDRQVKAIYSALLERANGNGWLRSCMAEKMKSLPVEFTLKYAREYVRYFVLCEEEMAAQKARLLKDERREKDEEGGNGSMKFQKVELAEGFRQAVRQSWQAMQQHLFTAPRRGSPGGVVAAQGMFRLRGMR